MSSEVETRGSHTGAMDEFASEQGQGDLDPMVKPLDHAFTLGSVGRGVVTSDPKSAEDGSPLCRR